MKIKLILSVSLLFGIAGVAFANGLAGQRLEKTVGPYIIDIGTDQSLAPQADVPIRFDFNLLDAASRNPLPFTDVDVYMTTADNKSLADADLAIAPSGPTLFTYAFPAGGNYNLQVTFYNGSKLLADGTFPITLGGAVTAGGTSDEARYLIFGMLIGGFVALVGKSFFVSIRNRVRK